MSDSDSQATSSDSDSSSELNIGSTRFNPLKALYSSKLKIPVTSARLHDNVHTLEAKQNTLGGFTEPYDEQRIKQIRASTNTKKLNEIPKNVNPVRRFLPEQQPVQRVKPMRFQNNVFLRLEKGFEGPLGQMQKWMEQGVRVRVYIRKQKGIRGHVSGVLMLFDKHWNLAVRDVCETYHRRNYRYSENRLDPDGIVDPQDCSDRLRRLGIVLPPTTVRRDGKKNVIITRKVSQLLIRGEQVVLVTLEPSAQENATRQQQ
uniref:Sm domain-containing protein n=1 Tax=Anopheles farauti TaxID=69004 RepID=A0A182QSS6_9DIPT